MTTKGLMLNDSNWLVQLKHLKAVYSTNILVNQRFPASKQSLQKNVTGVTYYKGGFTWRCVWRPQGTLKHSF